VVWEGIATFLSYLRVSGEPRWEGLAGEEMGRLGRCRG